MKTFRHIPFFLFLFVFQLFWSQKEDGKVLAKIENLPSEGLLKLRATATNRTTTHQELNYLFVAIKKGGSGNLSNNKQSGKFTLTPDETKKLSELNINLQKNDALKVFLYIRDEQTQKMISKDSLEINGKTFEKSIGKVIEKQLSEITGLTIDDTKTKIGKDFYDYFYMEYSKSIDKSGNAITISELPTMGRSSQINVSIDDKTLYSFMSNPSDDYLKEQVNLSLKILTDYNQKKNLIKNEFRY